MATTARRTRIVRPLRGGQITIPIEFRRELGIDQDSVLQVTLEDNELRIRPFAAGRRAGDTSWFKQLYDLFAPAREEILANGYTEEEINEAIDEAVAAVRHERRSRG